MFQFEFRDGSKKELDNFVETVLDKIKAKSGTRRKKMYAKGHGVNEPSNCFSISYGFTNFKYLTKTMFRKEVQGKSNLYETTLLTHHPELKTMFQQIVDLHCPEHFKVEQVQINKNWWSPPHRDNGNVGESWILGLGDYEGGETVVEYPDNHTEYDIKYKFIKFNGSKYTHWTKPFSGTRYSLVFYQSKEKK